MQFRAKHRNPMKCQIQIQPSSIASECSSSVFDRSDLSLFKPFLLVIKHADDQIICHFQNERREKAINLALVCVEKATLTGKVKSDMSSNRAPGQEDDDMPTRL